MTPDFQRLIGEATRLTSHRDLAGATAAIQSALGLTGTARHPSSMPADVIDVEARLVSDRPAPGASPAPQRAAPDAGHGRFIAGEFAAGGARHAYKLYVPPGAGTRPMSLVVMLHGCTQDPDDFANGTGMNERARTDGFYVLYPAQSQQANPQRCWNWFKHSHQQRGRGEPAWLAAMTRDVVASHTIDPERVYAAGLSAGGAMAAILGETYPDVFAAVGVHSGLAAGIATDLPSALAAMKSGAGAAPRPASGVPTIVFHGDADKTVHPGNGARVLQASIGVGAALETQPTPATGRRATRQVHRGADGTVHAESWVVHGSPHAWSGGRAQGSYTDPRGPDATDAMLRFFSEQRRRKAA